jgi:hypothetical protein
VNTLRNWSASFPAKERLYAPLVLLLITLLILGIFALVLFALLPNARTRGELITQLAGAEQSLVLGQTAQAEAPTRVSAQIRGAETSVGEAATHFLSEAAANAALNQLYQYARVSGVTISELKAQSAPTAGPTAVANVLRFTLQVTGTLPRLMNFLARIEETSQPGFALTNVVIEPEKERHLGRMDVALYTSRYAAPGGVEPLPPTALPSAVLTGTAATATPTPTASTTATGNAPGPATPSFLPTVPLLPPALPTVAGTCTNLVVNGDFERLDGWLFSPSISPPQYSNSQRQAGLRAMQLGRLPGPAPANRSSYSSVRQLITIPATANRAILYWWQWAGTQEAPAVAVESNRDRQELLLLGPDARAVAVVQQSRQTEAGWQQRAADLSAYRGQSLYLYFNVFNDGNALATWLYLDEVVLRACGLPDAPSATPTFPPVTLTPPTNTPVPPVVTATPVPPGSTPTTPPGVTNTPTGVAGCRDLLVNGSFESSSGWLLGPSIVPPQYTTTQPQAGARAMQLGTLPTMAPTNRSSYSSIRQLVTLPANANYLILRWWEWAGTQESTTTAPGTASDRQEVLLLTPAEQVLTVIQRTRQTSGGWQERSVDLSAYRGRAVYLYFNVFNDSNTLATWLYVDEVALLDCVTPPGPTVVPTATPMPTVISPLPTPTLTATATNATSCTDPLINGGFEGNTGWVLRNTPKPAAYTTEQTHTGSRSVRLGIPMAGSDATSFSSIMQEVTIPMVGNAVTLRWWQWVGTEESTTTAPGTTSDRQEVLLLTPADQVIAVIQRTRQTSGGWQEVTADLNGYRGQTLKLYFNVYNDGINGRTWMYIDDVQLICTPS